MATEFKTLILLALIATGVIAAVKSVAAAVPGSSAMRLLANVAFFRASEAKEILVGEAATGEGRSATRAATLSVKEVSSIERSLIMQLSPHEVFGNMDVHLDDGLSTDEAEAAIAKIEAQVREEVPEATRIFVELEPTP